MRSGGAAVDHLKMIQGEKVHLDLTANLLGVCGHGIAQFSYVKSEHPCFLLRSVGPEVLRPCSWALRPSWLFSEVTQRVSVLCCLGYSLLKCIHQSVSFHSNLQSCKYVSVRAELYDWFLWGWWDMSMALVEPSLSSGSWTFFLPW